MHQEKKMFHGNFFIFVQKNINRNGFQKIKIGPVENFEKRPKTDKVGQKNDQKVFMAIFVKRQIKPLGKIF